MAPDRKVVTGRREFGEPTDRRRHRSDRKLRRSLATNTMATCDNCGGHVSDGFVRVFSDDQGESVRPSQLHRERRHRGSGTRTECARVMPRRRGRSDPTHGRRRHGTTPPSRVTAPRRSKRPRLDGPDRLLSLPRMVGSQDRVRRPPVGDPGRGRRAGAVRASRRTRSGSAARASGVRVVRRTRPAVVRRPDRFGHAAGDRRYPVSCRTFNGWYIGTQIGSRDLGDEDRYDLLPTVWDWIRRPTDRCGKTGVWRSSTGRCCTPSSATASRIVDDHTAAEQFARFEDEENAAGRAVTGDRSWLLPPNASSTTHVFHSTYDDVQTPNFFYRDEPSALQ